MSLKIDQLCAQADELIRNGRIAEAKKLLHVPLNRIAREHRLPLAKLFRRVHQPNLSLKMLNRIVYPPKDVPSDATISEKSEYAVALSNIGATNESLAILDTLPTTKNPEVLLFKSFALFAKWNYQSAIPLLQQYTTHPEISGYAQLVGKINLGAALVFEKRDESRELLTSIIEETHQLGNKFAWVYAKQLLAELYCYQRNYSQGEATLEEALASLDDKQSLEGLFLNKWLAVIALYRDKRQTRPLQKVQEEAIRRKHFETVRNCDYHRAIATQDLERLFRVIAGTPFPFHNDRLLREFGGAPEIPIVYDLKLGNSPNKRLELSTITFLESSDEVRATSNLKKLLAALSSDFYRPMRLAELHAILFPEAHYNPDSSPHRIGQLVFRLRGILKRKKLPIHIQFAKDGYRLEGRGNGIVLAIPIQRELVDSYTQQVTKLREIEKQTFSVNDAAKFLDTNVWTARRLLNDAIERQEIFRSGSGNKIVYQFTKTLNQKLSNVG